MATRPLVASLTPPRYHSVRSCPLPPLLSWNRRCRRLPGGHHRASGLDGQRERRRLREQQRAAVRAGGGRHAQRPDGERALAEEPLAVAAVRGHLALEALHDSNRGWQMVNCSALHPKALHAGLTRAVIAFRNRSDISTGPMRNLPLFSTQGNLPLFSGSFNRE